MYSFQRVIALTTIAIGHDLAGDLADRTLLIEPAVIEVRRDEEGVQAARAAALPSALGAVLDLVAGVLAGLPHTTVENAPRMADFAKVLAALDAVTGWGTLASYRAKVASLALSLIEGSTLARALYRLATDPARRFVTHTAYDVFAVWSALGIPLGQRVADTHLLSKLLDPDERAGHGLKKLAARHLDSGLSGG